MDEVSPWGGAGDRPRLHWFGLTEGWYGIQVGEHEMLRYRRLDHPDCYIGYYLARLWEDLIVLTRTCWSRCPPICSRSSPRTAPSGWASRGRRAWTATRSIRRRRTLR